MKESKIIVIVLSIILILLSPLLVYSYSNLELMYDILISIVTGIIVSIIVALCQYFVAKSKIKNAIFNSYFDIYKAIYVSEHKKILFHYNVMNIYKKLITFSDELSKNISEYFGFINNKSNRLYKKLNPTINPNYDEFNVKNFVKLLLPFNDKKFKTLIIPTKEKLEKILREIDSKKFDKDFKEYERIFNLLNK